MSTLMLIESVYAHTEDDLMGHHMFSTDWWGGMFWVILFWFLVIIAIVLMIFYTSKNLSSGKDPIDVLKERYAKGEIDKKEFEEKKKGLEG